MVNPFVEATEHAIEKTVTEFQSKPKRYWDERDLHWMLYHRLRLESVFLRSKDYPFDLIRAEFQTMGKHPYEGENGEKGHYDLVVLDPDSYYTDEVQNLHEDSAWDDCLPKLPVLVAMEIKLWQDTSLSVIDERVQRDIDKLTAVGNKVRHPYFLNFVRLDFRKPRSEEFYHKLRDILKLSAMPSLRILCVPSGVSVKNAKDNWLCPS